MYAGNLSVFMTNAQLKSLLAEINATVSHVAARPTPTPCGTDAKPYHKHLQTVKLEKKDADAALVFINVVCAILKAAIQASLVSDLDEGIKTFYIPLFFCGEIRNLFNSISKLTWNQTWDSFSNSSLLRVLSERWDDFKHTPGASTLQSTLDQLVMLNQVCLKHDNQAIKRPLRKASTSTKWHELVFRHDFLVDTANGLKLVEWDAPEVSHPGTMFSPSSLTSPTPTPLPSCRVWPLLLILLSRYILLLPRIGC
jgi:hypothetical protein